jgi:dTMP kinase
LTTTRARRGLFFTFEGPEGSGKSLQARLLIERLRALGLPASETREPGGTPLGDQVRELLLLRGDLEVRARSQVLLLCAARAQLVELVIRPALARGDLVVCDRFADSTLAYQGYGLALDLAELRPVISFATGGLTPNLTILLDIPVREGLARKAAQRADAPAEWNRFEAEGQAFHERVRAGYQALAAAEPERWRRLDARKPPGELAEEIWALVVERMGR